MNILDLFKRCRADPEGCREHRSSGTCKSWYDGYHFGRMDVYCPWDVMNYIRDIQRDSDTRPKSYWMNTSDNGIIRSFIDIAGSNITKLKHY